MESPETPCFATISASAISPKLEGMILFIVIHYVDCVCMVTFGDWLELCLASAVGTEGFHTASALSGQVKLNYMQAGMSQGSMCSGTLELRLNLEFVQGWPRALCAGCALA